ncbi:MAG: tripartite tricarboxylate transporter substrate-binding protein, partial [Janthinobacterium lividum]
HMAGELFKQMAGVDILHIPYKGSSPARVDVISGHVDMMFDATTTMASFIKGGKAVALATTGTIRSEVFPELPTVAETVPGYDAVIWLGLMGPKGMPDGAVDRLNRVVSDIVGSPEVKEVWSKDGVAPMVMQPAAFRNFMDADVAKWAKVVKLSGARANQ